MRCERCGGDIPGAYLKSAKATPLLLSYNGYMLTLAISKVGDIEGTYPMGAGLCQGCYLDVAISAINEVLGGK